VEDDVERELARAVPPVLAGEHAIRRVRERPAEEPASVSRQASRMMSVLKRGGSLTT
jgi:hypothetical protein